jgi:hypothetical protein
MNAMELGERKGLLLRIGVSCVASIASYFYTRTRGIAAAALHRARSRVTDVIVLPGQARYGLTLLLLQVLAMVAFPSCSTPNSPTTNTRVCAAKGFHC